MPGTDAAQPLRICFVCSGNICRSPSAEVVMRSLLEAEGLADRVQVSSAGLGDWHVGERADPRSAAAMSARGYDVSRHRARFFESTAVDDYDLLVAMDRGHLRELQRMAPPNESGKVRLLMSFGPDATEDDVPDPYYGGDTGFDDVLSMVERGCRGLLAEIRPSLS